MGDSELDAVVLDRQVAKSEIDKRHAQYERKKAAKKRKAA